jgi:hypothetical protein
MEGQGRIRAYGANEESQRVMSDDLAPRLVRLKALRPFLRGTSITDLDLIITITEEGMRRALPRAQAVIATILDVILSVDPRLAAGPLAAAARAAEQAVDAMRKAP